MDAVDVLQGLWRVVGYEENGIRRPAATVEKMGCLLILAARHVPESHGTWGCIVFPSLVTNDILTRSTCSLQQLVAGLRNDHGTDFHVLTGGVFYLDRTARRLGSPIDFLVYHGAAMHEVIAEHATLRGIFECDGTTLTLCLADTRIKERPTAFNSTQTPGQSLAVYTRYDIENGR